MTRESSLNELVAFLESIEPELDWRFDLDTFDDRFRLQKYVLLAQDFGFSHEYRYGMHLRGPYSPSLAEDYYSDFSPVEPARGELANFDAASFADLVSDKDVGWLEVAATFRQFFRLTPTHADERSRIETAIERTVGEKNAEREEVQIIVDELQRANVL